MKLKCYLGSWIFFFWMTSIQAQGLMQQLVSESCNHFRTTDYEELSTEEVQEQMTGFFGKLFRQHAREIKDSFDLNIFNDRESSKFGEQFGLTLTKRCPMFLQLMLRIEEAELEDYREEEKGVVEGTLVRFEGEELLYFILKDDEEQEHRLLWLGYFWGSENFYRNRRNMIGKRYKIRYVEKSYFQPKQGKYDWVREIYDLDFK